MSTQHFHGLTLYWLSTSAPGLSLASQTPVYSRLLVFRHFVLSLDLKTLSSTQKSLPILSHHSLASYLWFSSTSGCSPAFQTLTYSGLLIFWIFVLSLVWETFSLTRKSLPLLCCHGLSPVPLSCSPDTHYLSVSIWMQQNQLQHLVCPRHSKLRNLHCVCA